MKKSVCMLFLNLDLHSLLLLRKLSSKSVMTCSVLEDNHFLLYEQTFKTNLLQAKFFY